MRALSLHGGDQYLPSLLGDSQVQSFLLETLVLPLGQLSALSPVTSGPWWGPGC